MTAWWRSPGWAVHHPRVGRLRRQLGWDAIDPQPRWSPPAAGQVLDPSRWRGVPVARVHQVWRAAITSIRWASGVVDLVAVRDGCSRSVRSGAVSITRDGEWWWGGLGAGAPAAPASDLHDRAGGPVPEGGCSRAAAERRPSPQHGWARAGPGPGVGGAVVAHREIGGGLCTRRPHSASGTPKLGASLRMLPWRTGASGPGISDPSGRVPGMRRRPRPLTHGRRKGHVTRRHSTSLMVAENWS